VLPELFALKRASGFGLPRAVKRLKDRQGEDRAADRLKPQQHDGPLDARDLAANAGVGAVDELKDPAGERGVTLDDLRDLGGAGIGFGARQLEQPHRDRRQCRQFLQLLEDQLDAFFSRVGHT
jgi:hypothetical protein